MENQQTSPTETAPIDAQPQLIKDGLVFWSKHVWKWAPKPSLLSLASDGSIGLVGNKGVVFTANVSDLSGVSLGPFGGLNLFFKDGRKFRFATNPTNYSSRPNEQLKELINNRSAVHNAAGVQATQIGASLVGAGAASGVLAGFAVADEFAGARQMGDWAQAFSRFTKVTKSKVNGLKVMLIVAIPVIILAFVLPFILGPLLSK